MGDVTLNGGAAVPLSRGLGFWTIWAIGVGAVVGDGVFLYTAEAISTSGASSMVAFIFAGLTQMAIMVAMCELSIGMPSAGGPTVWVVKYLNRFWGLLSGLAFSVGWIIIGGSVSVALGRFIAYWTPNLPLVGATILWAAVFFTAFLIMNIVGVKFMARGQLILCLILIGIMVVFGVGGLVKGMDMDNFTPFAPAGIGGITESIPIAVYAFMGASCICFAGEECKRSIDLARALIWSSVTFIVVYTIALLVVIGNIPYAEVTQDMSPFTQTAEVVFGPLGGHIVNLAAAIAAGTCLVSGCLYTPSRLLYSMSLKGYMPKIFGRINPKTKTPVHGLVIIWIVGMIGIIVAAAPWAKTEDQLDTAMEFYNFLCNQAVIAWIISWALSIIAGIRFRIELGGDTIRKKFGWAQPLFPLIPVIALVSCGYCLYLSFYDAWQFIAFAIWMGGYCVYYAFIQRKYKAGLISDDMGFSIEHVE